MSVKCMVCNDNIVSVTQQHMELINNFVLLMTKLNMKHECTKCKTMCFKCLTGTYTDFKSEIVTRSVDVRNDKKIIMKLDEKTSEFTSISQLFTKTVKHTILRIEKNINMDLLQKYNQIHKFISEQVLFHGSPNDNYTSILRDGFNISCAKESGLMGKGIYFADDASYSTSYTHVISTDIGNVKNILVCRVKFTEDTKHMESSNIHCVYNQYQGYPEYIIYYVEQ